MECGKARKTIYLSSGTKTITNDIVRARQHIKHCAKCSEFFSVEGNLRNLIREIAPKEKAPSFLREKVLAKMAETRSLNRFYNFLPSGRIGLNISLALIGIFFVLVVSGSAYLLSFNKDSHSLVSKLAEDHLRNIPEKAQILSTEPEKIKDWFRGKVDFAVLVPEIRGAKLKGGRLCHIGNNRVALLFYEKDENPISLFVMGDSLANQSPIGKLKNYGKKLHKQSKKGCNVIMWRERGLTYALVADIKTEELTHFVPDEVVLNN